MRFNSKKSLMRILFTLLIISTLLFISCSPSTDKQKLNKSEYSIEIQKEVASLTKRLTLLDSLVKTDNSDPLSLITTQILRINQRLNKILSPSDFVEVMKNRDVSNTIKNQEKHKVFEKNLDKILNKNVVIKGYFEIGMTDKEIRGNLGEPDIINRTVTSYETTEQWVYNSKDLYLYFEDGKLTSYQEFNK